MLGNVVLRQPGPRAGFDRVRDGGHFVFHLTGVARLGLDYPVSGKSDVAGARSSPEPLKPRLLPSFNLEQERLSLMLEAVCPVGFHLFLPLRVCRSVLCYEATMMKMLTDGWHSEMPIGVLVDQPTVMVQLVDGSSGTAAIWPVELAMRQPSATVLILRPNFFHGQGHGAEADTWDSKTVCICCSHRRSDGL